MANSGNSFTAIIKPESKTKSIVYVRGGRKKKEEHAYKHYSMMRD